jgi:plasmid stabilization system protein ParE
MLTISWSKEAVEDYASNIDYLLKEWTIKEAEQFVSNAADIIRIISVMPEAFPVSNYKSIRKALVCKQINLLYLVQKSEIVLLRFWNNKQNPESFKR